MLSSFIISTAVSQFLKYLEFYFLFTIITFEIQWHYLPEDISKNNASPDLLHLLYNLKPLLEVAMVK